MPLDSEMCKELPEGDKTMKSFKYEAEILGTAYVLSVHSVLLQWVRRGFFVFSSFPLNLGKWFVR